jgi:hypothetical protein
MAEVVPKTQKDTQHATKQLTLGATIGSQVKKAAHPRCTHERASPVTNL